MTRLRSAVRVGARFWVLGALWLLGCSADEIPRTQVMVVIDAETAVRAESATLRVDVEGGPGDSALTQVFSDTIGPAVPWPVRVALVPEGGDALRRFRVHADARDGDGDTVVRTRVLSGYVEGRTKLLELWLEGACRGVSCGAAERCVAGACVDEEVDPETLPDWQDDSPDAGVDAAIPDAGPDATPPDAEPDATEPPVCDEGWGNCDGDPTTGCETNLMVDPSHCGACGDGCDGSEVCSQGTCQADCPAGEEQCGSSCFQPGGPCGNCGTYACSQDTVVCVDEGECQPGHVEERAQPCGNCGVQVEERLCSAECGWGSWSEVGGCQGEGCTPGEEGDCECDEGGTGTRVCSDDCQWGECEGCEVDCDPESVCTRDQDCALVACPGGEVSCVLNCCVCVPDPV